ncbi:MAG TPA: sulfate adenylyltransferase [Candidatus Aminicenantes bacterium]|nr:sulfate adenylyltransferase [Candidatus Aminicenantes bacterium]
MITPHGGRLIDRSVSKEQKARLLALPALSLEVSEEMAQETKNISDGLFSPLEGFLKERELLSVLETMRLPDNTPWTVPILLDIDEATREALKGKESLLLTRQGTPIARVEVEEIYTIPKEKLAQAVYGTLDEKHPGVQRTHGLKPLAVGGKVFLLNPPVSPFPLYDLSPRQTREEFARRGWKKIVGFQTRNVPHLGHEYIQKAALTVTDGLFINPIIGRKKSGDFQDDVILNSYEALRDNYFPADKVFLSIMPTEMRYAGPREAIHHAIMRKNYGCTHFIVGRDHAGVGSYYPPYAAQEIFASFPDLEIEPVVFKAFFFCKKCNAIASEKTCPHPEELHINFAGTKMRNLVLEGKRPPEDQMRPEVADVIIASDNPLVP